MMCLKEVRPESLCGAPNADYGTLFDGREATSEILHEQPAIFVFQPWHDAGHSAVPSSHLGFQDSNAANVMHVGNIAC